MTPTEQLTPADHRTELIDAVQCLLLRQLPSEPIAYVWPEHHRILFRTANGHHADVEVLVNFDVVPIAQKTSQPKNYSVPVPTESTANRSVTP